MYICNFFIFIKVANDLFGIHRFSVIQGKNHDNEETIVTIQFCEIFMGATRTFPGAFLSLRALFVFKSTTQLNRSVYLQLLPLMPF